MPLKNTNNKFLSISSDSIEDDFPIIGIGASFGAASTFTPGNGYQYVVYTGPGVMTVERGGFVDILLVGGGGGGGVGGVLSPPPPPQETRSVAISNVRIIM